MMVQKYSGNKKKPEESGDSEWIRNVLFLECTAFYFVKQSVENPDLEEIEHRLP